MIFRYIPSTPQDNQEIICASCGHTTTRYALPRVEHYRINGLPVEHERHYLLSCFDYCAQCGKFSVSCSHLGDRSGFIHPNLTRMNAAQQLIQLYSQPKYQNYILGQLNKYCETGFGQEYLQKFIDQYNTDTAQFTSTDTLIVADLYRQNGDMSEAKKICNSLHVTKNDTMYGVYNLVTTAIRDKDTCELIIPSQNYLRRF